MIICDSKLKSSYAKRINMYVSLTDEEKFYKPMVFSYMEDEKQLNKKKYTILYSPKKDLDGYWMSLFLSRCKNITISYPCKSQDELLRQFNIFRYNKLDLIPHVRILLYVDTNLKIE